MRKGRFRGLWILALAALALAALAPTVWAFEERSGEKVVIGADEVIQGDLYVSAATFVLDGTIEGDLVVVGQAIAINGTVEGDLMGGGQVLTLNGKVLDDARIAGVALTLSEGAEVGGDVVAAGTSLESKPESEVGGDLLFFGYQALLAGVIEKNIRTVSNGLEIQGAIAGDVVAQVSSGEDSPAYNPMQFIPSMPSVPNVRGGLLIGEGARIGGDLEYESPAKADVPAGTVEGQERHILQATPEPKPEKTPTQRFVDWILRNLRRLVGLVVVGLLLVWLVPSWLGCAASNLGERPWPVLGLGAATFFGYPVAVLLFLLVLLMVSLLLILVTLGNLGGALIWIGVALVMLLSVAFGLAITYVSKIVIGFWGGRLLLKSIKPEWAEKPVWSMLVGVVIVALLLSIPFVGGLFWLALTLFGLGTLWFLCLKPPKPAAKEAVAKVE
jgi:hypothetical protein